MGLSQGHTACQSAELPARERLSEITDLKDQLGLLSTARQKPLRSAMLPLLRRWEQLLQASEVHRQELLEKRRAPAGGKKKKKKNDAPNT